MSCRYAVGNDRCQYESYTHSISVAAERLRRAKWLHELRRVEEILSTFSNFRELYNQNWLIERLGFQSPVQARQRLALEPAA